MRSLSLPILLLSALLLFAQDLKTVSAEFVYYAPETLSLEDAKKEALNRAKIQAIAEEFGTLVSQTNFTNIQNMNEHSNINFQSIGMSEVKGEWIEDLGKPEYDIKYIDGTLVIGVKVKGKARELKGKSYECQAKVLRHKDNKNETDSFNDGDQFIISFMSSVKGYITIYLSDNNGNVSCLLPYASQSEPNVEIKANVEYIFFDRGVDNSDFVDEYYLTCPPGKTENNTIFVVFSKNVFSKALDKAKDFDTLILPRELSESDFNKWLTQCRRRDPDMSLISKFISISNK